MWNLCLLRCDGVTNTCLSVILHVVHKLNLLIKIRQGWEILRNVHWREKRSWNFNLSSIYGKTPQPRKTLQQLIKHNYYTGVTVCKIQKSTCHAMWCVFLSDISNKQKNLFHQNLYITNEPPFLFPICLRYVRGV